MKMNNSNYNFFDKNKAVYNFINISVIVVSIVIFVFEYNSTWRVITEIKLSAFFVLLLTVFLVHVLKALRLYFALYGSEVKGNDFIKTYCKVTPVSVVLPFKIGEIFRMYCYGKLIGNVLRGMVIVLFDRFMDTAALVTVIFLSWILNSEGAVKPDLLMCFLLLFLIFTFAIYFVYPGIKKIWIKSLLKSKATHNKIAVLSTLNKISDIYIEIENVSKGRGVVLYILSIIAWVVEIGSLYLMGAVSMEDQINSSVFEYLRSAIRDNQSLELQRFIAVTILFLIGIYAILKIVDVFSKKGNKL